MKKIFSYKQFMFCFVFLMFLNSIFYVNGYFNPNINRYSVSFIEFLFFLVGNFSVLYLILIVSTHFKTQKGKKRFLLILSFVLCLYLMLLTVLANILNFPFSFKQLTSFGNEGQGVFILNYVKFSLKLISDPSNFSQMIVFVILLALSFFTNFESKKLNYKKHYSLFSIFILLPLIFTLIFSFHSPKNTSLYKMKSNGVYNFLLYDLFETLLVDNFDITNKEYQEIDAYLKTLENKTTNEYTNLFEDKNLIILQLEQINNLVIDLVVDGIEIMPNLNKLARDYMYFSNFYSSSGAGNTSDTEMTTLTGIIGNGNNLSTFSYDKKNINTIAKDFNKKDYYTYGTIGVTENFYDRKNKFMNSYGFDDFFGKKEYTGEEVNHQVGDYEFLDQSFKFHENKEKYFGYWIASTSHMPYVYNEDICKINFKTGSYMSNYLNYCMYVDDSIGNMFDQVEKKNMLEDTVFMMFGDHTPSLFLSDVKRLASFENIDKIEYQTLMSNTPFIMVSDKIKNELDSSVHSLNDLYTTISNLFNLDSKYHFGVDMFSNQDTFYYNPRNSLTIFDDYTFTYSNQAFYETFPSKEKKNELYNLVINRKRMNDLILFSDLFE